MSEATKSASLVEYRAHDGIQVRLDFETIREYLVRGRKELVTKQEMVFYMGICKSRALNPFAMDCYLIKYTERDPAAIVVARAHYQTRARQQPDCKGWKSGVILRRDGKLEYREGHLVLDDEELVGGWFEAKPAGWDEPKRHTVGLKGYIKKTREGETTQFWHPEKQGMMIEKVAEAQGLRTLWSKEFANLYVEEEMVSGMRPETPQVSGLAETPKTEDPVASLNRKVQEKNAPTPGPGTPSTMPAPEVAVTPTDQPGAGPSPTPDDPEVLRRALVKTFDAAAEKTGIPESFINGYLFEVLGRSAGKFANVPEIKAEMVQQGKLADCLAEIARYANAEANKAEEGQAQEEPPPAPVPAPAPGPAENAVHEHEFVGLKTPGMKSLLGDQAFCKRLLASPDDVTTAFAAKAKKVLGTFSWDWVRRSATGQSTPGPALVHQANPIPEIEWIREDQYKELDKWIVSETRMGWNRFMPWALATGNAKQVEKDGTTYQKVTAAGAEEILKDKERSLKAIVSWHNNK